jgi:O-antigen/teichoic acid export membrane protein
MNSLIGNIPRYILAYNHGEAAVGILAALFYLTLPGGIVVSAYCDSMCGQLARWSAEGAFQRFGKVLILLVSAAAAIGFAGGLIAWWAGKPILSLCYGARYALHAESFVWLMAGAGFLYISTVLGYALFSLRAFHIQVPFRIGHLVAIYVLCLYFIPREGLLGAAKSIFISSVIFGVATAVLLGIVLRKKIQVFQQFSPTSGECPPQSVVAEISS